MGSAMVDRATSRLLIGPDWAMNAEICELINRDLAQSKHFVKGVKRRLRNKKPKVQLLALILLETVIKNCGDIVHMHVAEKGVLSQMVKMVKKKPDFHVKEKILVLIDTWQETFGGPRARYPQYYAAYQELLHAGAVFPQRSEKPAPVLTPSQAGSNFNPDHQETSESSEMADNSILSLTEIKNARGVMDVLSEMLNAVDPANKEGLKDELIVDLVGQCRSYKRRVFHVVNTSSDEELLSLGLALNEDLQRVLAKHDAIAAGIAVRSEKPKSTDSPPALVDIGEDGITAGTSTEKNGGSTTNVDTPIDPFQQLLLPDVPHTDDKHATNPTPTAHSDMDLLSWDDADPPTTDNQLALVPANVFPAPSMSDQNSLVLTVLDNSSLKNGNANNSFEPNSSNALHKNYSTVNGVQMPPPDMHSNDGVPNSGLHEIEQTCQVQGSQLDHTTHMLNGHAAERYNLEQQQPPTLGTDDQGGVFPPPPWETQPTQENQPSVSQPLQVFATQTEGISSQMMSGPQSPGLQNTSMQSSQATGMPPYPMQVGQMGGMMLQQPIQIGQMTSMHFPHAMQSGQMMDMQMQQAMLAGQMENMQLQQQALLRSQMGGYPYAQLGAQYFDQVRPGYAFATQRPFGLSTHGDGGPLSAHPTSFQMSASSSLPRQQPMRPTKPEDKLFGDLLNIAKVKQSKA